MLAENIKKFRKKLGFSQKDIAEKIFLTPQTVSKWEKGLSEPCLKDLCKLSAIFSVSTDELLGNSITKGKPRVMIAIDGGGTKTEFVMFDSTGKIWGRTLSDGSSPNVYGIDKSVAVLSGGIDDLIGDKDIDLMGIYVGVAGGMSGSNGQKITAQLKKIYPYTKIKVNSDVENVIGCAIGIDNCISVICGTGAITYIKDPDGFHRLGGWGYYLDEGGSGFTIGRDALRAALAENEGMGEKTQITELIESILGTKVWNKIDKIYSEGVDFIASFSKVVFKAYDTGDKVAQNILDKNISAVADVINFAVKKYKTDENLVLAGGVVGNNREVFTKILAKKLDREMNIFIPDSPPIFGAAMNCCNLYSKPGENFSKVFEKNLLAK